ncbi:hypothetical protein LEMLEM_LOCUS26819 [Lemmus lemmus]
MERWLDKKRDVLVRSSKYWQLKNADLVVITLRRTGIR